MKKMPLATLLLLSFGFSARAFNETTLPDKFSIKNCQNVSNCSYMIVNGNKRAELLYAHHKPGAFYFFDDAHQKQITFRFRGENHDQFDFSYGEMRFDAFDQQDNLIAKLTIQEDSNINYTLNIYEKNGKDLLVMIDRGVLGTEQIVHAKDNKHIIAKVTRPLWTLSTNSDITMIDKGILSSELNSNLLIASLQLYSTHFRFTHVDDDILSSQSKQKLHDNLAVIAAVVPGLTMDNSTLSTQEIIAASNLLTQHYQQSFGESYFEDDTPVNRLEKLTRLFDLGKDLIFSQTLSVQEEQAILHYLLQQIEK